MIHNLFTWADNNTDIVAVLLFVAVLMFIDVTLHFWNKNENIMKGNNK